MRCGDVTISLVLALGLTQQDCNVVMRDSNVKRLARHWEDTDEMRGGNLLVARTCEDHDDHSDGQGNVELQQMSSIHGPDESNNLPEINSYEKGNRNL